MPKSMLDYTPEQLQEQLAKLEFQNPPQDPEAGTREVLDQYLNEGVTARYGHDRLTQTMSRIRGTCSYTSEVRAQINSTLDDTSELGYAQALNQPGPFPRRNVRRTAHRTPPRPATAHLTLRHRPPVPGGHPATQRIPTGTRPRARTK